MPNRQATLREIYHPLPARGKTALYMPGTIVGNFISAGDKPFGVEQGGLFYIRDKAYYTALGKFLPAIPELIDKFSLEANRSNLEKIYAQYVEKEKFENKNNSPMTYEEYIQNNLSHIKNALPIINKTKLTQTLNTNPLLFYLLEKNYLQDHTKWLIKLDSKDSYNQLNIKRHTYSVRRDLKTTTIKRFGEKVYQAELKKHGVTEIAARKKAEQKMLALSKRRMLLKWLISNRMKMNKDVTAEVLATKHAAATGMQAQDIQVFEGTWEKSSTPKLLTISVWEKNFKTFEEFTASKSYNPNNEINITNPMPVLEFKGGKNSTNDYLCYNSSDNNHPSWVSAANKIQNLGQHLTLLLRHGDYDAIGKLGQNKGLTYNLATQKYTLFGIDFGHTFTRTSHLKYLRDDFSTGQTKSLIKQFKQRLFGTQPQRYAMLYDTPYSDKMAGMHILLKQHNIAVAPTVRESFKAIWENPAIVPNSHNQVFADEIAVYEKKISTTQDKKAILRYRELINKIQSIQKIANQADAMLLKTFDHRLNLTIIELDLLSGMEKLLSVGSEKSPNGEVILNQIRVDRQDRITVQFVLGNDKRPSQDINGKVSLVISPPGTAPENVQRAFSDLKDYLLAACRDSNIITSLEYDLHNRTIKIPSKYIATMQQLFTDPNIRRAKGMLWHPEQQQNKPSIPLITKAISSLNHNYIKYNKTKLLPDFRFLSNIHHKINPLKLRHIGYKITKHSKKIIRKLNNK